MPRMLLMNSKTTSHRDRGYEHHPPDEYQHAQCRPVSNLLPMVFPILMTSTSLPILTPHLPSRWLHIDHDRDPVHPERKAILIHARTHRMHQASDIVATSLNFLS